MADVSIFTTIASMLVAAGGSSVLTAIITSRSARASSREDNAAKAKVHGDELLLKIVGIMEARLAAANAENDANQGLKRELVLRDGDVAEAITYMRALLSARATGDEVAWAKAERTAEQWIKRMERGFDAKGAQRQEEQIDVSARTIAARAAVEGEKR